MEWLEKITRGEEWKLRNVAAKERERSGCRRKGRAKGGPVVGSVGRRTEAAHLPGDRGPREGEADGAGQKGDPWRSGLGGLELAGVWSPREARGPGDASPVGTGGRTESRCW